MGLFTSASLKTNSTDPGGPVAPDMVAPLKPFPRSTAADLVLAPELESAVDTLWARLCRPGNGPTAWARLAFLIAHWEPDEGGTTLAAALAIRAAELNPTCTFCVADFDFFNPGLSFLTGLEAEPGLAQVLSDQASLDAVLATTRLPNLSVAPAGFPGLGRGAARLHDRCRHLCEQLTARFHYVLLDMPMLREHPQFAVWASGLAEALLVVRAGQARQKVISQAIRTLKLMRLKVAAVALNGRDYYLPDWLYART